MKKTKGIRLALCACLAGYLARDAVAADPTITDVTVRQRWPWSRLVDIDYVLTCDPTQRVDVAVTAYNAVTVLDLSANSLSGDLSTVAQGARRIVWDPGKSAHTNELLPQFHVQLTPSAAPSYMIVDLTKSAGAEGQITYRYDWSGNWHDITNHTEHMTTNLVLRRITAGTFVNAASQLVTLTNSFYVGVFEITQEQWKNVMGSYPDSTYVVERSTRPAEKISYTTIRGSSAGTGWPTSAGVDGSSFIGQLRSKTGLAAFDLPTEAQWEYACRARTITIYNDGDPTANTSGPTNRWLHALGRYRYNGGQIFNGTLWYDPSSAYGPTNATAKVGSYLPNRWGLYDMHGNVHEYCLDWYGGTVPSGTDPSGPTSNTSSQRVIRGGGWQNSADICSSVWRGAYSQVTPINQVGLRVFIRLP